MFDGRLNLLAGQIHAWARGKGFYDRERLSVLPGATTSPSGPTVANPSLASEKLMLIVSEVAEAQSALRDQDTAHEAEEVADILIRVLDYAAWRGIDIEREVESKMIRNQGRPHLHGRTF